MPGTPTIHVTIDGHGKFETWANTLDAITVQYTNTPTDTMRASIEAYSGLDLSDVRDRSALLVIIADYEGF